MSEVTTVGRFRQWPASIALAIQVYGEGFDATQCRENPNEIEVLRQAGWAWWLTPRYAIFVPTVGLLAVFRARYAIFICVIVQKYLVP